MGSIKITEFEIITIKNGVKETWELGNGETDNFIVFKGKIWNLIKIEYLN
jgi:hypothetical protein